MRKLRAAVNGAIVLFAMAFFAGAALAQFTGSINGVVKDPSGAAVPKANVTLTNNATKVSSTATTDAGGNYQFQALQPGAYTIEAIAEGFDKTDVTITLTTEQTLDVPIALKLKGATATVEVTGQAPVLNTAETRNQMTLENQGVAELPIQGRNMVTLATLAPGVSGLGTQGSGQPGQTGTPGSAPDNYSTETQVDASANGEGQMSNSWVVDGLDVTSGIRQGVLNLTPNPDSIQEASFQVNTFSAEYGRSDGLQTTMTSKSGTNKYHGFASEYYYNENMWAREEFSPGKYSAFHSNNISAGIGGPIPIGHQFFGFFDIEPLRSSSAQSGFVNFVDAQYLSWANTNFPPTGASPGSCVGVTASGSLGTCLLGTYSPLPKNLVGAGFTGCNGTTGCYAGTYVYGKKYYDPVTNPIGCAPGQTTIAVGSASLPCGTQMVDGGFFNSTAVRNGTQWFMRLDKYFGSKDRIYGSFYRTTLSYGQPGAVPAFSPANNQNWERALQVNETHTFSANTINEVIFGVNRIEGTLGSGAPTYTVPDVNVTNISGFGVGFAQGDFIQHNYHWRDVLTHISGAHTLKFGYEGWYGDDVEPFQGPYSTPSFNFDLTTLVQDLPQSESSVMYNPITGQKIPWSWNAASMTHGLFAEDTWKVRPNVTLTYGLRWDDQGNPWSRSATTVFGNFYFGPGQTFQQQVANGFARQTYHALNRSVTDLFSPRIALAWDPTGSGNWLIHGGFGVYNNWLTQANVQEEFRGNPPGPIIPTFVQGGSALAGPPVFELGKGNTKPFDFPAATLNCGISPLPPCLNSTGGIAGVPFNIGGINPNLKSPRADIWAGSLERRIGGKYVASVNYSGQHSYDLVGNNDQSGIVSYGVDINRFPGDLELHHTAVRLNPNFGAITYSANDRYANYEGITFDFRGRFSHGFFDASYTRSESKDDAGNYPTALNANGTAFGPNQYYGPSPWDVPSRFSLTLNYQLPGLGSGEGILGHLTGGWGISGTSIYQSGYPFTVINTRRFIADCKNGDNSNQNPLCPSASDPFVAMDAASGDYQADGDTVAYPNVSSYTESFSRANLLPCPPPPKGQAPPPCPGAFGVATQYNTQFTVPGVGTFGNEKRNAFREPNFAETDAAFYKDNRIRESLNLQIRFEFFNIFNRPNLGFVDANPLDGNFGKVSSQQLPRWWDLAVRFTF